MSVLTVKNKSDQVRDILLDDLKCGKYKIGGRVDSDNELSRNLGISKNTVREAISTLVSEGYLKRIQGKGTFVVSTSPAASPSRMKVIRLVCRDAYRNGKEDSFVSNVLRGIHIGAAQYNCGVCVDLFTEDSPLELLNSEAFRKSEKDGIILAGFSIDAPGIAPLLESGIPVVSAGRPNQETLIPYVDMDHAAAVKKAMRYLFDHGHTRIALLEINLHAPSHKERLEGYLAAYAEAGLKVDSNLIFTAEKPGIRGDTAIRELRRRRADFTAILTYGDDMLLGALRQLREERKMVPADISVVTYTTYALDLLNLIGLDPTRIQDNMPALGAAAVQLLHCIAAASRPPRNIILQPDFIIGNTVTNLIGMERSK